MREFDLSGDGASVVINGERQRTPLPTWEQLLAIEDVEALDGILQNVLASITKIETDLEFRPGDDDWHARARGALTAHQICRKNVERRLRQFRPKKVEPASFAEIKLEKAKTNLQKQQAHAEVQRLITERQEAKAARRAEEQRNQAMAREALTIERVTLGNAFMRAAARKLPPHLYAEILDQASNWANQAIYAWSNRGADLAAKAQEKHAAGAVASETSA